MKTLNDEIQQAILRAAGEESSIYDVICELRTILIRNNSLDEYIKSISESVKFIELARDRNLIDFYKQEGGIVTSITNDIYNTYMFIP